MWTYNLELYRSLKDQCIQSSEEHAVVFGLYFIIFHPIYYFLINLTSTVQLLEFQLRVIATLLSVLLIMKESWPKKLDRHFNTFYFFAVCFNLPFLCSLMVLVSGGDEIWLMQSVGAIFILILIMEIKLALITLVAGSVLSFAAYHFVLNENLFSGTVIFSIPELWLTLFYSLFGGLLFAHKRDKIEKEKIKGVTAVSSNIAHELRTPLASIESGAEGIQDYLPDLIDTYKLAQAAELPIKKIRKKNIELLGRTLDNFKAEARYANTIIDMLLVNIKKVNVNPKEFEICSVSYCINEAITRFPFMPGRRELVEWNDENDFIFHGKSLLVVHVLFNLMKNALYFIEAARRGNIKIWVEKYYYHNELHFKDTGKGIPEELLSKIFDQFYTKSTYGTGVGLSFCKMVMNAHQGNITCRSKENAYTEFILSFPQIDKKGLSISRKREAA